MSKFLKILYQVNEKANFIDNKLFVSDAITENIHPYD